MEGCTVPVSTLGLGGLWDIGQNKAILVHESILVILNLFVIHFPIAKILRSACLLNQMLHPGKACDLPTLTLLQQFFTACFLVLWFGMGGF